MEVTEKQLSMMVKEKQKVDQEQKNLSWDKMVELLNNDGLRIKIAYDWSRVRSKYY